MVRNLLVITYYFPPLGGVGVQRVSKFCKYLPDFGWKPQVIAPQPSAFYMADSEMLEEVKDVSLYRVGGFDSFRFREKLAGPLKPKIDSPLRWIAQRFSWPDTQSGYVGPAFRQAYRLSQKADAIFVTAPPWSNLFTGRLLKRVTGLPLIIDMRDPWVRHPQHDKSRWKRALNKRNEKNILEYADAVIAATRAHSRDLLNRYPEMAPRINYISNGFDSADFSPRKKESRGRKRGPLMIAYTGILGLDHINRGTTLYAAIRRLRDEEGITPAKLKVQIMGEISSVEEERIRRSGVSNFIERIGHLPHNETMRRLERSDLAWLPYHSEYSDLIVPAKTYEYIGSGVPILATVSPEHETALLVRETCTGCVAREGDVDGVLRGLKLLLDGVFPYDPKTDLIARFERRRLAEKLAGILDELSGVD